MPTVPRSATLETKPEIHGTSGRLETQTVEAGIFVDTFQDYAEFKHRHLLSDHAGCWYLDHAGCYA